MITMPGCTCSLCKECFKGQFDMVIQEQQVKHFNCPICQKPDMSNKDDIQEMYELLFVNMVSSSMKCINVQCHHSLKLSLNVWGLILEHHRSLFMCMYNSACFQG